MNAVQAFLLGLMAGWTPPVLVLAWMLWRDVISQEKAERHT
jgi:hypothetical protein